MGKVYEALERARMERTKEEDPPHVAPPEVPQVTPPKPEFRMEREMALLYQHIDSLLGDSPKKVIQFIAAREGEGTSTIVQEFARISATILGKSVFMFDADVEKALPAPTDGTLEGGNGRGSTAPRPVEEVVPRNESSSTAVCLIPQNSTAIRKYFYSPQIDSFWEDLRQQFDLVLIDSPPFETSPDGIAIARRVDGVVIVVEAEKTRWTIADRLKETIQLNGGNVLGVVFNKRRYYIPEFVYKRI